MSPLIKLPAWRHFQLVAQWGDAKRTLNPGDRLDFKSAGEAGVYGAGYWSEGVPDVCFESLAQCKVVLGKENDGGRTAPRELGDWLPLELTACGKPSSLTSPSGRATLKSPGVSRGSKKAPP